MCHVLRFFVAALKAEVTRLAELVAKLSKNSWNSSKPPSSDIVKPSKSANSRKKKRKIGGQPGHAKHERPPFSREEIERVHYQTGCPVLLCGKPAIYAKLGFREVGGFSEVTDQLASRIVIRRNLTEHTRCRCGEPDPKKCICNIERLFSIEDIRKLVKQSNLKLHVSKGAEKWLQSRASTLGMGGIGKALVALYLAFVKGDAEITAQHLEDVDDLSMGHEDAERIAEVVAEASGMRRVV